MGLSISATLCYGFYIDDDDLFKELDYEDIDDCETIRDVIEYREDIAVVHYGWEGYILAVSDSVQRVSDSTLVLPRNYAVQPEWDDILRTACTDLDIKYYIPDLLLSWDANT